MARINARRALSLSAFFAPALLASACAFPSVTLRVSPGRLAVVAGDRGTVLVMTRPPECRPPECVDTTGRVFDYAVQNLPPGVTYTIDRSLQSPSTPGLVRITFEVRSDVPPRPYDLVVRPVLDGHSLGNADLILRVLPAVGTTPGPEAVAIAGGSLHSLAALADGSVAAWGDNTWGQLGLGHRENRSTPTIAPELDGIVDVAASINHGVALTANGLVWNWGVIISDTTSVDTADIFTVPFQEEGVFNIQAIAAGGTHSLALKTDGTVWAWGGNNFGQLGDGSFVGSLVPQQVRNLPRARAIGAASFGTSFAVASDGSVWKWGGAGLGVDETPTPTQVAGLRDITAISARHTTALALDLNGRVWSWGNNDHGQLGDGTTTERLAPAIVPGLTNVVATELGARHAVALLADGTVWEWGELPGRVGDPDQLTPRIVPGLTDIQRIAAGDDHVLALSRCGQVWGWGRNDVGQLSDVGPLVDAPTLVPGVGNDSGCDQVTLRVSVAGDGADAPPGVVVSDRGELRSDRADVVGVFATGTTVTLTALAEFVSEASGERFAFDGWAIDCAGAGLQTSIVLDRRRHCAARYRSTSTGASLLTVTNGGGRVTSTGGGILGPAAIDCGTTCAAVFPQGTVVTLSLGARPAGFSFTGWAGDCTGAVDQTAVTLDTSKRCLATFRPFRIDLVVAGNGRVTSDRDDVDCSDTCSFTPLAATTTLIVIPAAGWQFAAWGGDCAGTASQIVVNVDADKRCTATFSRIPGLFFLTMVVEGQGSVASQPAGIVCPGTCVALFPSGSAIDLSAQAAAGWNVSFWFDDCASGVFGLATNRIVMSSDRQCRIRFTGQPRTPVAAFSVTPPIPRSAGQVITFDASATHVLDPATGTQDFSDIRSFSWDLDGDGTFDVTGSRSAAAIVQHVYQASGDYLVRLRVRGGPFDNFDEEEHSVLVGPSIGTLFGLTVNKSGSGAGSVASDPPGLIGCDPSCVSAGPLLLEVGTVATLVAQASAGSSFDGWTGPGCTGADVRIQVTMTAATSCTAMFPAASGPFTLTVVVNKPSGSFGTVMAVQPASNTIDCRGATGPMCAQVFPANTVVIVRPNDSSIELGRFASWSGCDSVGALFACTVTLTSDRTVVATFSQ